MSTPIRHQTTPDPPPPAGTTPPAPIPARTVARPPAGPSTLDLTAYLAGRLLRWLAGPAVTAGLVVAGLELIEALS